LRACRGYVLEADDAIEAAKLAMEKAVPLVIKDTCSHIQPRVVNISEYKPGPPDSRFLRPAD
jgi:hypothetical protein